MSKREPPNPDDKFEYYLERRRIKGKEEETINTDLTALNHLKGFLKESGLEPGEITEEEAEEFIHYLEDEVAGGTARKYAHSVEQFYRYYANRGTFETNPVSLALEDKSFEDSTKERREIPFEDIQKICREESHPLRLVILVTLLKTGVRLNELVNIDLEDINLDHVKAQEHLPEPRYEIENEPDTLYIPSDREGNKREVSTRIPIDSELKQALLYWLAARLPTPPEEDDEPLLQLTRAQGGGTRQGARPSKSHARDLIKDSVEEYGWYESDASYYEKLTPHAFRHFFTTYAEREAYGGAMDEDVVSYIRGDTEGTTKEDYRHFWGDEVRIKYLGNIFKLFE